MDKSKKINIKLAILLIVTGLVAVGVLALAFYIPTLLWLKPIGFLFLAIWGYIAIRLIKKEVIKNIDDM